MGADSIQRCHLTSIGIPIVEIRWSYGRLISTIGFPILVRRYQGPDDSSLDNTSLPLQHLTHWGRVTHICMSKLTIIVSDNGLSPGRCQAIIWTNDGILLIGPLGTNFREILIEIYTFSFKKIYLKMSSEKCRPFCLGLNVLIFGSRSINACYVWNHTLSEHMYGNNTFWIHRYNRFSKKIDPLMNLYISPSNSI